MSQRETLTLGNVQELLNKNDELIRSIKDINEDFYRSNGRQKKAIIVTYGCQMN